MRLIRNCAKAIIIRDGKVLIIKYADEGGEFLPSPEEGICMARLFPEHSCENAEKRLESQ